MSYFREKKRWRRNPVPCVLCGEEQTRDWDHICYKCRDEWKRGHAWAQAEEKRDALPDGMIEASIAWYWYLYHFAGNADNVNLLRNDSKQRFRDALLELVGASRVPDSRMVTSHSWAIGYPRQERVRDSISQSRYILRGDERTLALLQQVYECACELMAHAYDEGLRRGRSFVQDLADGKMTVKDLERHFLRD